MQTPTSRTAARTVWSDYKQRHTVKILACIAPSGSYVWSSDGYPGRISDLEICEASGFFDLLEEGDCLAADKGFDSITPRVLLKYAQVVAPTRRWWGNPNFTATERQLNEDVSNCRVHVERHFARVQNWGFFSKKKISIHYVDIFGLAFQVVSHLCNLGKPLCKENQLISDQ